MHQGATRSPSIVPTTVTDATEFLNVRDVTTFWSGKVWRVPAHVPVAVDSLPCASGAKPALVCGVGAGTMSLATACEDRRRARQTQEGTK